MKVYFDTGIFLYLVNPSSIHHMECKELLGFCQEKGIQIATSVETVKEIVIYAKNTKQLEFGLEIAQLVTAISDYVIPTDTAVMKLFLKNSSAFLSPSGRDLIHLSICQSEGIKVLISYDSDMSKFKDLKSYLPPLFIKQYS